MEIKDSKDIVKKNTEVLDKICGLLEQVISSERTWNKGRAGYLIGLRDQLTDIITGNYSQLLSDSNEMAARAEANIEESRDNKDIVKKNTETLDMIYGLLKQIISSEINWNKERAGYLVRLKNQLEDIITGNYGQLLSDSNEMTALVEANLEKSRDSK